MAKYDVTFVCGHSEIKELYGKEVDRQKQIKYWEESCTCSECFKMAQLNAAKAKADEMELKPLEGSEKQVAWAEKIRISLIEKGVQKAKKEISAKWFIDNRFM